MRPPVALVLAMLLAFALADGCQPDDVRHAIVYKARGPIALQLDLYRPKPLGRRLPVLVVVHGGFWQYGDRTQFARYCSLFTRRGFAVACIDYSLAGKVAFPAAVEDVADAVRFLRTSADRYDLDPDRIALLGISAGAHLVTWACLPSGLAGVHAVVDLYGPMDLTTPDFAVDYTVREVFGSGARLRDASPLFHIDRPLPPFLIVHGDHDAVVPLAQSRALHDRLLATGTASSLLVVRNAGHDLVPQGGVPDPPLAGVADRISVFLHAYLK